MDHEKMKQVSRIINKMQQILQTMTRNNNFKKPWEEKEWNRFHEIMN
jgi:hypothetical protein